MAENKHSALPGTRKLFTPVPVDAPDYDPQILLNALLSKMQLKNHAALSQALDVGPGVISRIRRKKISISGTVLIRMHEASDISIQELMALMFKVKS